MAIPVTATLYPLPAIIPEVKKIDDLTIDFVFKKPFAPFLYNLNAVMVAPRHVLEPITKKAQRRLS